MMLHNSPIAHPVRPETRYDTLVVSQDRQLFAQFSAFLKEFEPDRKPLFADDTCTFSSFEKNLCQCDVMICDMRSSSSSVELGAHAVDCVPAEALVVGLTGSDHEDHHEVPGRQQNLRFSGILDNRKGWLSNWNQITAIKQAWHNPLMVSRIEEVPVGDVLQMIASGGWNVVVHVTGYGMSDIPLLPDKACKGCISFYRGEPQTAWSWDSAGMQAIFDLLSLKKGILQVVKNLCTPTVRNVYLQTDEILLSHAVALDESFMASLGIPVPSTRSPVSAPRANPGTKNGKTTWWTVNGPRFIAILSETSPGSFPVRVMHREELHRIPVDQTDANMLLLYGSTELLSDFFSLCARGFSAEKISGGDRFPVIRLGRSGEPCLYIAGTIPSERISSGKKLPAVILNPGELNTETCGELLGCGHCAILPAGTLPVLPDGPTEAGDCDPPVMSLPACDMSWQGVSGLLHATITALMTIK